MKLIEIERDVYAGQCKGALLRIQIGYTAIFILPSCCKGWVGTRVGIFSPKKVADEYKCRGFYFYPWFARDCSIGNLPKSYVKIMRALSFKI